MYNLWRGFSVGAVVIGGFVTRIGIGGLPFLFPLLYLIH